LSAEGKEAYAKYKQEQAEKAMQREQEKLEHGVRLECKDAIEKAIAENFDGYTLPRDTAKGVIRQFGKERVEFVLANIVMNSPNDGRYSVSNREWARSIIPYSSWDNREFVVSSHPAVVDGFINQVRRYMERDREPDRNATDKVLEMAALVPICGTLGLKDVVEWNEETDTVRLNDGERVLEGKEAFDMLFTMAADYMLNATLDGDMEKALQMDGFLKEAGKYAERYDVEQIQAEAEPEKENTEETVSKEVVAEPDSTEDIIVDDFSDIDTKSDVEQIQAEAEPEPVIDKTGAVNFRITPGEETTGKGFAPKEKFRQNVDAIKTLEKIESEHRIATPEEQEILAKYVGWGGLADAFDETKANWASEYKELKELLSPEEYASARESTLNAHYTSPVIIKSIYDAIDKRGFSKGNILEPAVGTGNFFGMLPEKMQESKLYGVELDGLTGRIARRLYPNADVKITGFEKTDYPNDFFDVAVGNVPFGQYKVVDKAYDKHNFLIHDYFFAKTLDKVRPGGVVAFVTSKGTMDKKSPEVRKYLAQRAELLGAIRLPNTAFKENAGTEVTSDILFLKKRDRVVDIEPDWVHLTENEDGIAMNQYFADHPEMIMGKMEMVSGPYGMEATCTPDTSISLSEQLEKAIAGIEGSIDAVEFDELDDELQRESIPADPSVKNYSYTLVDDRVYYRENSIMKPVEVSETMEQRMKGMVQIRDCTQELIDYQLNEYPDDMIKNKQTELN
ncbi:MAG: DUF3849 domain-containing protein, partial [Lachnospiraceae bacterium]|nr:DUF3849 domain-containing protein [Lachnospiraceae bacterium]